MHTVLIFDSYNFLSTENLLQKSKVLVTIFCDKKNNSGFQNFEINSTKVDYNVINKVINDVTFFSFLCIYSIT